jgi:hypothetical protein
MNDGPDERGGALIQINHIRIWRTRRLEHGPLALRAATRDRSAERLIWIKARILGRS